MLTNTALAVIAIVSASVRRWARPSAK